MRLLLDEPSAGLSPIIQDQVFEKITEIAASGVSVVLVEQNARHCLGIADRGYVLDQGRNAYTGTGRELLHDPKVIDLYLGTLARQASSLEASLTARRARRAPGPSRSSFDCDSG